MNAPTHRAFSGRSSGRGPPRWGRFTGNGRSGDALRGSWAARTPRLYSSRRGGSSARAQGSGREGEAQDAPPEAALEPLATAPPAPAAREWYGWQILTFAKETSRWWLGTSGSGSVCRSPGPSLKLGSGLAGAGGAASSGRDRVSGRDRHRCRILRLEAGASCPGPSCALPPVGAAGGRRARHSLRRGGRDVLTVERLEGLVAHPGPRRRGLPGTPSIEGAVRSGEEAAVRVFASLGDLCRAVAPTGWARDRLRRRGTTPGTLEGLAHVLDVAFARSQRLQ